MSSKERWEEEAQACEVRPLASDSEITYVLSVARNSAPFSTRNFTLAFQGINHKDAEAVPVARIREQLDEQFRRVLAPAVFGLDIGPVPSTAGMPSKPK